MRRSAQTLGGALALFVAANLFALALTRDHQSSEWATSLEPPEVTPDWVVIAGSYGTFGLDVETLGRALPDRGRVGKWVCAGTGPTAWSRAPSRAARGARTAVVVLPALLVKYPALFRAKGLRSSYGMSDAPRLLAAGLVQDTASLLANRLVPLFRLRKGISSKLRAPIARLTGMDPDYEMGTASRHDWSDFAVDELALDGLERTIQTAREQGMRVILVEWPTPGSQGREAARQIRDGFRPFMEKFARASGVIFVPAPEELGMTFDDEIHVPPGEGGKYSAWLAEVLADHLPIVQPNL